MSMLHDTPCLKTNEYVDNAWVVSAGEHSWSTCASGFGIAGIVKSSSCKSADCIESSLCRHGLDMATCYNANWDEDTLAVMVIIYMALEEISPS